MTLNRRIAEQIDEPTEKRRYVQKLFAGVARKYDLTNDVMSFGLHRRWKRRLLELADLRSGHQVLDLAAGTGDLSFGALAIGRGASLDLQVIATDLTAEMMRVGRGRSDAVDLTWIAGDAEALPFPDASFDRVLVGYGLRNFADLDSCLAEIYRCLRANGRLITLDFGHPRQSWVRKGYFGYLNASTRLVGWALHGDPESYVYIPESLRRFPDQQEVARRMEALGFERCGFEEPLFGTMAINYGDRAG